MKNIVLRDFGILLLIMVLILGIFKFKYMMLFCHYISLVLIVSIIYQIRNFLIEYKKSFLLKRK